MAILVTGCAGFIGSNFTKTFNARFPETEIVGIDDFSSGRKELLFDKVKFYEGSITDSALLEKIFSEQQIDYVFHFAAMARVSLSVDKPVETSEVNIMGTLKVMDAARRHGTKRFIFSSSSSVYGGAKMLPTKESENFPDPKSPYAAQKYAIEPLLKIFSSIYGLDTVGLRYFNVYGPGQFGDAAYSTVISAWLELMYFPKEGKKPFQEDDGTQSRDFCYVDNVVNANILAMQYEGKLAGEVFNVGHGERTTVNEVKALLEEYTGKKVDLEYRPARVGDVRHTQADISKISEMLGYKVETDFKTGLKKTVEWFESRIKQ